jgi:hypothetical protein
MKEGALSHTSIWKEKNHKIKYITTKKTYMLKYYPQNTEEPVRFQHLKTKKHKAEGYHCRSLHRNGSASLCKWDTLGFDKYNNTSILPQP